MVYQELFAPDFKIVDVIVGADLVTAIRAADKPAAKRRIQLLLPLCLTGDKPELALTIQREDGFYAARTCLTLDMAYNNARLICRPETSWIKR